MAWRDGHQPDASQVACNFRESLVLRVQIMSKLMQQHRRTGNPFQRHQSYRRRLLLELLEDRRLLAASYVDINPNSSNLDTSGNPNGASGGRFNGLAAVPGDNQVFYGASEWGGLYKTTDGGNRWGRLDGHLPTVTWDVEVMPNNVNRVFATSFYDGFVNSAAGIQVSNDAGATWISPAGARVDPGGFDNTPQANYFASATRIQEMSAFGISFRPDAPNTVYVGTNVGLARSVDGGQSWTFVDPAIPTLGGAATGGNATIVWDVVAQAGGANGIIDVVSSRGHFRSLDGGNTWSNNQLPGAAFNQTQPLSIAVSPDESYVIYVSGADVNIYESTDGGATAGNWRNLGTPDPTPQGRIPFVATNQRTNQGGNNVFDLWVGDVGLYVGVGTTPPAPAPGGPSRVQAVGTFAGNFALPAGAHADAGDIAFDSQAANDASPRIFSSDGGVYRNMNNSVNAPAWEQPTVTPHATWLYGMTGVVQPGAAQEDLYFTLQDAGNWSTQNAGANSPTWNNGQSADGFDVVADANQVIVSNGFYRDMTPARNILYGGFLLFHATPNLQNLREFNNFNYPGGNPPAANNNLPAGTNSLAANFQYIDTIAQYGPTSYVLVTDNGIFFTTNLTQANINAQAVTWTQLGAATTPANAVGVKVAMNGGTPTFFVLAGNGSSNVGNQLWTFTGTGAGNWTQIDNRGGQTGGVGIFAVDPNNPNNLYASNFAPGGLRMVFSNDGGLNWSPDPILDTMMTGGGAFQYQTTIGPTEFTGFSGYAQPTLLAYDPNNANNIVAGGHDSGVFLSTDGGSSWRLLTDPFTSDVSGVPHLPRPRFAHFNGENPAAIELYIGTVGRGVWRIDSANNFDLDPDRFEPNDMLTTSTVMGSLAKITERDLTIDSQTDVDFFQYTAQDTGKLIINTYFNGLQGDLDLRVRDSVGNIIASGIQSNVTPGRDRELLTIPVVSQQRYYIEVYSGFQHTNTYDLEIENFAAPVPDVVLLDPADDSGMMDNDNITAEDQPDVFIQADLSDFAAMGISILSAAQAAAAQTAGAAVEVFVDGITEGFADVVFGSDSTLFDFSFGSFDLSEGLNFVTAAVRLFDGQQNAFGFPQPAQGRTKLSGPLLLRLDTTAPATPAAPDLLTSSDTGESNTDNITSKMQPAFSGSTEANAKVRVKADGVVIGQGVATSSGNWEVTVEPLADAVYEITVEVEDTAGNVSDMSAPLTIEIDSLAPNTPWLDLVEADDSGRHNDDNITNVDTPLLSATTNDPNAADHLLDDNFKYRIYDRLEESAEILLYDSFAAIGDFTSLTQIFTTADLLSGSTVLGALADGIHNLKLEVEDRAGNISDDFLLDLLIDTVAPTGTARLHPDSDTGIWGFPDTMNDGITSDMTPSLVGETEANALVRADRRRSGRHLRGGTFRWR